MSTITQESTKHWPRVEQELQFLQGKGIFPLKDIRNGTEITFEERKKAIEELKNTVFTISVCGVVKAGKSTFLNALLFGNDILPTFATPMTAKLTFIEYTKDPHDFFEVHFYSEEEFTAIENALKSDKDPKAYQQFKERLEMVGERGFTKNKWVGHAPIKDDDLNKLSEYVADPSAQVNIAEQKGNYTPFVKEVHISIHNEAIKNVRVVDTPGLRDSNVINAQETTRWINKTHAVIYILQNRGVSAGDIDFLLLDFISTPNNRLFIINQIDRLNNPQQEVAEVKKYIKSTLGNQSDYKEKNLFGPQEKIYGYSALGVLLDKMVEQGISIEKYQEDYELIQEKKQEGCKFDEDKIEEKVSSVLYQNQGCILKESGKNSILQIYAIAENNYKIKQVDLKAEKEDLFKEDTTLDEEVSRAEKELKSFNEKKSKVMDEVKAKIEELSNQYNAKIMELTEEFIGEFNQTFSSLDKVGKMANVINTRADKLLLNISTQISNFKSSMEQDVGALQNRVVLQSYVDAGMNKDSAKMRLKSFDQEVGIDVATYTQAIQKCMPTNWFTSLFSTARGRGGDVTRLADQMASYINGYIKEKFFSKSAQEGYHKEFSEILTHLAEELGNFFESKKNMARMSKEQKQAQLKKVEQQLSDNISQLDTLMEQRRKFEREMK